MATEADTPRPVPLTESVHLTTGEFDQPHEPTDYLLKSVHTQESSNFQNGAARIDIEDDLAVSKGESFLESPLEAKVASEDKCRKQQPVEAVKMPHEAEKHLEENEQKILIDEETMSSEEKIIQQVEEMVNVNTRIEENKEEEKTKIDGYSETGTSKEVDKPEGSLHQNTEVSSQTPPDGSAQTAKEACLNNEIENCVIGTEATHIEGSVREQSSTGAEEKQPESCSSLLIEQGSETIKLNEKINTDEGRRNDSDVAESLHIHNKQIAISESKELAEDELAISSVSSVTDSSTFKETDLIFSEIEKTTGVECTTESQETINLSENVKDTSQIAVEMQKEKDVDAPAAGMDDTCVQKEDNSVSEDTMKEIPEETRVCEIVEKPGETDRSEADKVKDETNSEQEVSDLFMKQEKGKKSIEVEIKEHERFLHGSSIQKDEPENEKICMNVVTDSTDTICSGENILAITSAKEEAIIERQEESSIEKQKKERSTDIEVNDNDAISNKMDAPSTESTETIESAKVEISNAADYEELVKVQELATDEKESNYNRTNIEEQVEKKKDSCDVQMSKSETSEEPEESGKYKTEEVTSDEVIGTAFVEENIDQSSQPADPREKTTALRDEENKNVDNADNQEGEATKVSGIGEVTSEQSIDVDGTQILAEIINEDVVKISQDTVEVAEVSGKEHVHKQITQECVKGLSQESVEECIDENLQNEQKNSDISSREVQGEAETAKIVDDISRDLKKNDEISASTLQTSLQEKGSLQIKEVTASGSSASETKGKDEELVMKDREPDSEVLQEFKENKETEPSKHEEVENILQNNKSVQTLEESTGMVSTETEKDDSSKIADTGRHETVESPQYNVYKEETQNDGNSERSNNEVLETCENDENSNLTVETCLIKEKEILEDYKLTPTATSVTAEIFGDGYSKIKDEQMGNKEAQTEVNDNLEESSKHEENLERTEKNKPLENLGEPVIVESSETKNHVSNEIIKKLEVGEDGSDIKDNNTVFEAVDEDRPDKKADNAEFEAVNKDENDSTNDKAESETVEQADDADFEPFEKDNVDKKEDIAAVETVEENKLQKVADDAEIEKDAAEVETVKENGLNRNADVEIAEKDFFDKPVEEGGVDKSPDNVDAKTIKEDDVDKKTDDAEIDTADSSCNEPKKAIGKQEDPKEQTINDGNDSAPIECAEPSPLENSKTDTKNAEGSNDKAIEPTKSEEKDENFTDDANQNDEIPSICISTSSVKEAERSHEEYQNVLPLDSSPEMKEEEDVSRIKMDEDNENIAAFEEKNSSVDEEPSKEVDDITSAKNKNDESTSIILQNSMEEEQEILERDNQAEAETSLLKDEDHSSIKADEGNDNNAVVLELKEDKQEEKLKDEESTSMISEGTMADGSSKITGGMENAETPDDIGKVAKEENTVPEASDHHYPVESQNDEECEKNSSREILGEFETARKGENIAQEKDQKDESPCTTLPCSSVENEKSPSYEDADTTIAEASIDESREKDDTPVKSGENNDCNDDKIEVEEETTKSEEILEQETEKRQMESVEEASRNEEKLDEEQQKNEPEEFLEHLSNVVAVETDAGTLSKRAINTSLEEVGPIQNDEGKIEEGRGGEGEEEETENMNEVQVEKTAMEKVSTEANISGTSEGTEKNVAMQGEVIETDILSLPTKKETSATKAQVEEEVKEQDAVDTVEKAPEEENIITDRSNVVAEEKISEDEMVFSASKQEENKINQTAERDFCSEKQMTEEGNAIEDKPKEPKRETDKEDSEEEKNEEECNETEPKEEVEAPKPEKQIIQTAERGYSSDKQVTEEGNAIEDKPKEPKRETDKEDAEEKKNEEECNETELREVVEARKSEATGTIEAVSSEEENINECNVAELKEEVEEPKSDAIGIIEAGSSEEAKGSETSETKEGSEPLPTACTNSLPEISSSNSEDKDKIIDKEEPNPEDDKVTKGTKEISQSEPHINNKVQTESSIPTSEESELKLNPEETTLDYVSTEPGKGGENKDQESLQAVDKIKKDTDEIEKETSSEGGGLATKSEASSKEAVEMEKSEIELKGGDIATKAEVDISNETVQMEERAIAFGDAIPKERDLATKAEVSSKEDAEMNIKTIELGVPISGEENSAKDVEEASSKEAIGVDKVTNEPGTAILEGALTTKPEASSKETIKVDTEEIKTEEAIYKEHNSAKNDLSLQEVEAEKFAVEPEIATSEAENPVAMVEVSLKSAAEVEKAESEPEAAVFKERDLATKDEVALNKDVEVEKEATQPEKVLSQEVDPMTEVGESFDADISKEEHSAKTIELPLEKVQAEKFAVEPEIATSEAENPIAMVELNSETATEVEKVESDPEAAAFKEGDSTPYDEAALNKDVEAEKKATQHEVVVSREVDPVTQVEENSDVAISEGGNLATKVKASIEATIQPEVIVSQEVDAMTKTEASSKVDTSEGGDSAREVEAIKEEKVETVPEVSVSEGGDLATKGKASSDADIEPEAAIPEEKDSAAPEDVAVQKSTTEPEVATLEEVNSITKLEKANIEPEQTISEERDSTTKFKVVAEDDVAADKSTTEPELEISEEADSVTNIRGSTKEAELEKVDIEPEAAIFEDKDSAAEFKVASERVETKESTTEPEVGVSEEVNSATIVGGSTKEADDMEQQDTEPETDILKKKDSATEAASKEDVEAHKSTTKPELTISEEMDSVKKIGESAKEPDVVEIQDTEPEAANLKEKDSAAEFEAASQENSEVQKSTVEPDVAFSEKVDSVTTILGSKNEADRVEKQDIEPEAASEEDDEALKSITEPGVAISEEVDSATEFRATTAEEVEAQQSTTEPEVTITEEAAISKEKDYNAEFEVAREEDAEVQKSTTESQVPISEEVYSATNVKEGTKEADKVEKQDIKPEAAISTQKDSVTELESASEEDAEVPKLTSISKMAISEELDSDTKFGGSTKEADEGEKQDIEPEDSAISKENSAIEFEAASEVDSEVQSTKTEVAISEVDSVTKTERSVNEAYEVGKSDNCGERDSGIEASLEEATKFENADVFAEVVSDTKVEESVNEAVEVEKAAVEPVVVVQEAEDSDAKVQICKENAEVEKEATEPAAAISTQRDLVTEAELSKEAVEVEKEATKAEESTSEAVVSDGNLEDRSVEAVEAEKAPTELEGRVAEVESKAPIIHETPVDTNVKSTESSNQAACSSEIETRGQGDVTVSETSKREIEENKNEALDHSCESSEKKSLHESQEIQQDVQEKIEATVEVEEYNKEPPKTDDTIEVATLTTEGHGDLEKTDVNIEKPDPKELYNVSVQEEKIKEVKESSSEGIEILNATEFNSNEVQKITEENDKQVQVPDVPSDSNSNGTETEGSPSNNAVETTESENVMEVETQDENADITDESKKESETVAESKHDEFYTAETDAEIEATVEVKAEKQHGTPQKTQVDETRESKAETGETGEKTRELSQEMLISQDDKTVTENDIPNVKTICEEVEKEQCETQENAEVAGKETSQKLEIAESKVDSDIVKESQKHELCSDETREADEVTKSISKNHDEEVVIGKEIIVLQAHPETKEQQETASRVLPPREEVSETKAASEEIQQHKREILFEADENPEISEQKATEEMSLQQEETKVLEDSKLEPELKSGEVCTNYKECETKQQSLEEAKDEIKQSFEGVEATTEQEVPSGQTLTEKASEVRNRPSHDELVLKEQENRNWAVIEKTEQDIDETEVLKHKEKETEERIFDKEESKKPEVSTEAIDTQGGAVQVVNEEDYESISKHDSRNSREINDYQSSCVLTEETKEQVEMTDISKEIQMDCPVENIKEKIEEVGSVVTENLTEKTAVSDKILDCGTETREDTKKLGTEFRSHERLVELEAEAERKIPEAAVTQSNTEEKLSKIPIGETESIPYEVKKEEVELDKGGAKDYISISHGEGTAEDKHVEFELKADDSNGNDSIVIEKEKNIEEVHKETEETHETITMVDQINTEKITVELCQAVTAGGTEDIMEKERTEVKTSIEKDLSKEVSKGITEEKGATGGTSQGENLSATSEKLIMNEAEPKKTTGATTITERSIETAEAIDESTELAKISLFDMMQRSNKEKQPTIQENEPKYEVKAEAEEKTKSDEEKQEDEDNEEHKKNDSGSDAPVMVEASKDIDVKVPHKKSHNILSGVGSKVKHSISKVKKAITGKSSHSKQHSPKSGAKEQLDY